MIIRGVNEQKKNFLLANNKTRPSLIKPLETNLFDFCVVTLLNNLIMHN